MFKQIPTRLLHAVISGIRCSFQGPTVQPLSKGDIPHPQAFTLNIRTEDEILLCSGGTNDANHG